MLAWHAQDPGFSPQQGRSWLYRHKPVTPTTQEVEDQEFKVSMGYRRPCFKIRKETNKQKEEERPQSHLRDSTHCADRRTRIRAWGAVRPQCCNPRDVYGSLPASGAKNMANSSSARLKRMKTETAYRKGHLQCPSIMCAHAFPPHLHTPSGIAHSEPNTTTVCGAWLRAGALGWSPPVVAVRWIS